VRASCPQNSWTLKFGVYESCSVIFVNIWGHVQVTAICTMIESVRTAVLIRWSGMQISNLLNDKLVLSSMSRFSPSLLPSIIFVLLYIQICLSFSSYCTFSSWEDASVTSHFLRYSVVLSVSAPYSKFCGLDSGPSSVYRVLFKVKLSSLVHFFFLLFTSFSENKTPNLSK
jgi:hypothetical protein